jgi:hypothetical protein
LREEYYLDCIVEGSEPRYLTDPDIVDFLLKTFVSKLGIGFPNVLYIIEGALCLIMRGYI